MNKFLCIAFGLALSLAGCAMLYTVVMTAPTLPMIEAWNADQWLAAYGLVSACALTMIGVVIFSLPAWTR